MGSRLDGVWGREGNGSEAGGMRHGTQIDSRESVFRRGLEGLRGRENGADQ